MPALELPPPPIDHPPLTREQKLSPAAQRLLAQTVGRWPVRVLVESTTGLDVGLWFRWKKIWVCATDHRLILFADGPRPFVQEVTYDRLQTTFYCHLSGELVFVPAPEMGVRSIAIGPSSAWKILGLIFNPEAGPEPEFEAAIPAPAPAPEPVAEEIAEPVTESEPVATKQAATVVEPPKKVVVEPPKKTLEEPVFQAVAEPIGEPIAEPIAEALAEPAIEPIAKPVEEIAKPIVDSIAEPIEDEDEKK